MHLLAEPGIPCPSVTQGAAECLIDSSSCSGNEGYVSRRISARQGGTSSCNACSPLRVVHTIKNAANACGPKRRPAGTPAGGSPRASSSRFRRSLASRLVPVLLLLLVAGVPQADLSPKDREKSQALLAFHDLFAWFSSRLLSDFGIISFASAALCTVSPCVAGACYEHGTAQICVCPMPLTGPTCGETASLCTKDCGIRGSSGLDCSSALCSLGTCTDIDVAPFFKCECGDFFGGTNCEIPTNPCTSVVNPCGQATCIFAPGRGSGTVTCECYDDWEVAPGSGMVTTKWGDSEVVLNPPCSVRVSRGIARISFSLSSGELIVWWTVLAISFCFLIWCCYSVATESCGTCLKRLRLAGQVQKAAAG